MPRVIELCLKPSGEIFSNTLHRLSLRSRSRLALARSFKKAIVDTFVAGIGDMCGKSCRWRMQREQVQEMESLQRQRQRLSHVTLEGV